MPLPLNVPEGYEPYEGLPAYVIALLETRSGVTEALQIGDPLSFRQREDAEEVINLQEGYQKEDWRDEAKSLITLTYVSPTQSARIGNYWK